MVSQESICITSNCLNSQSTEKSRGRESASLIIVTPTWQTQSWYPELLRFSVRNSIILLLKENLLKGPQNQQHPFIPNQTMQLAVWVVFGMFSKGKNITIVLQAFLSHQEQKVLAQHTHRTKTSGVAGVLNKTLIWFDVM